MALATALPHVQAFMALLDAGLPANCSARLGSRGDALLDKTHSVVVAYPDAGAIASTTLAATNDGFTGYIPLHGVGVGPEQALWAIGEAQKALIGSQPDVTGRFVWRIWQEQGPSPIARDDDLQPALYSSMCEFGLRSTPA